MYLYISDNISKIPSCIGYWVIYNTYIDTGWIWNFMCQVMCPKHMHVLNTGSYLPSYISHLGYMHLYVSDIESIYNFFCQILGPYVHSYIRYWLLINLFVLNSGSIYTFLILDNEHSPIRIILYVTDIDVSKWNFPIEDQICYCFIVLKLVMQQTIHL